MSKHLSSVRSESIEMFPEDLNDQAQKAQTIELICSDTEKPEDIYKVS